MDQSASVFSQRGSALYVSFKPTLTARPVQFSETDPELSFLIAQSFVAADKHVTGPVCYNLRVVECSLAAAYLHAITKMKEPLPEDSGPLGISLRGFHDTYFSTSALRFGDQLTELIHLTKRTLTQEEGYTREEIAKVLEISVDELNERFTSKFPVRAERFKLLQRTLHVFDEATRVVDFMGMLEHPNHQGVPDTYNERLGRLLDETQTSCRVLYECSCPELDRICRIAKKAGSYGSRLTGAGWGGCSVHIVPVNKVEAVKEALNKEYYDKMDLTEEQKAGAVVVSKPGGGSAVFVVEGGGVL